MDGYRYSQRWSHIRISIDVVLWCSKSERLEARFISNAVPRLTAARAVQKGRQPRHASSFVCHDGRDTINQLAATIGLVHV